MTSDSAQKPPVVMVHGMWSRPHVWDNYRRFFEERGYRVIAPALRHHDVAPGDQPPENLGGCSILDYAADLEAEIRRLPDKPYLIGHSMGGLLVQILAARDLARATVALSTAPCRSTRPFITTSIPVLIRDMTRWGFWRKPQRPSFRAMCYGVLNRMPEDEQRALYDTLVFESGRTVFEIALWQFDRRKASKVGRDAVSSPILFMTGTKDRITPARFARKSADYFGEGARYVPLDGHGHWVLAEPGWEKIADTCADFFARSHSPHEDTPDWPLSCAS